MHRFRGLEMGHLRGIVLPTAALATEPPAWRLCLPWALGLQSPG